MRTTIYQRDKEVWLMAKKEAKELDRSLSNFLEFLIRFYFKYREVMKGYDKL